MSSSQCQWFRVHKLSARTLGALTDVVRVVPRSLAFDEGSIRFDNIYDTTTLVVQKCYRRVVSVKISEMFFNTPPPLLKKLRTSRKIVVFGLWRSLYLCIMNDERIN